MSWLNPNWRYVPASAHGDPAAFARRQRERMRAAEAQRKAAAARPDSVQPIKRAAKG